MSDPILENIDALAMAIEDQKYSPQLESLLLQCLHIEPYERDIVQNTAKKLCDFERGPDPRTPPDLRLVQ
jgi:hypothetical protein|tara:strand:- start:209 stop:418 length:210 start_codon:yes stop_codon:yes gene_type:complete